MRGFFATALVLAGVLAGSLFNFREPDFEPFNLAELEAERATMESLARLTRTHGALCTDYFAASQVTRVQAELAARGEDHAVICLSKERVR
ncbi:MAG TPA: hypothetical protein VEA41_13535 [Salinarimonas sp.]|nr:hypothetical protein [Salinarimonas sp.]